jgi:hypothetical protein
MLSREIFSAVQLNLHSSPSDRPTIATQLPGVLVAVACIDVTIGVPVAHVQPDNLREIRFSSFKGDAVAVSSDSMLVSASLSPFEKASGQ